MSYLAQVAVPGTSTPTVVLANSAGQTQLNLRRIHVVNPGSSAALVSVFHDDDGTTSSDATLTWKASVASNSTLEITDTSGQSGLAISPGGQLAVSSDQAVTVTVYGDAQARTG